MTYRLLFAVVGILGFLSLVKIVSRLYRPLISKNKSIETIDTIKEKIELGVIERLRPDIRRVGLEGLPSGLVLVGLKEERRLEVYAQLDEGQFAFLKSYPFTAYSGMLGPKLKEGDGQIPEGIYGIEYLNPNSSYYLSMKISYPNPYDISKSAIGTRRGMGDDIFIHGKDATIGCIPIGDTAIEELFLLVDCANIDSVKVIISPRDFRRHAEFPSIACIDWEEELYGQIQQELFLL